jgi:hypothetical protein
VMLQVRRRENRLFVGMASPPEAQIGFFESKRYHAAVVTIQIKGHELLQPMKKSGKGRGA